MSQEEFETFLGSCKAPYHKNIRREREVKFYVSRTSDLDDLESADATKRQCLFRRD